MKYNKQQSLEIENYLDRHNCVRCHSSANLTIDHIIPIKKPALFIATIL